jgi:hypothetical protein
MPVAAFSECPRLLLAPACFLYPCDESRFHPAKVLAGLSSAMIVRRYMQDRVRVAAVAVDTKPGQIEDNLAKIDHWCRLAAEQASDLVAFQELSLSGFLPNHPTTNHESWLRSALHQGRIIAQTIPGPATEKLQKIAARHGLLISVGLLEDAGNLMFNTQILVDSSGVVGTLSQNAHSHVRNAILQTVVKLRPLWRRTWVGLALTSVSMH